MGAEVSAWDDSAGGARRGVRGSLRAGAGGGAARCAGALAGHPAPPAGAAPDGGGGASRPACRSCRTPSCCSRRCGRRVSRARFAGITGTNGKSTTTALLAHILAGAGVPVAAGGNLGPAALALPLLADDGVYVLEMSSYMLERLATLRFDVAAMLNLSADHLDRHGDMAGYAAAKRAIFARQTRGRSGGDRHRRCRAAARCGGTARRGW